MTNLVPINGGLSPFDEMKQTRQDGSEYWSARQLQVETGYARWEDFSRIVERAIASARNSGHNVDQSFAAITEKPARGGRPRVDYQLSRFGAYLTVMNGDPNMPKVAEAQAYFAIQTRTAEIAAPAPASTSVFDLMRTQIDQLEAAQRTAEEAKAIAAKTDARLDAIEGRHDWYAALGYARMAGIENTSTQFLNKVGRQASAIAKANGIDPVKVPHALYGEVNSYPAWVWEIAFEGRGGAS